VGNELGDGDGEEIEGQIPTYLLKNEPTFLVGPEIARGALKIVDVHAATDSADIFVAYPVGRRSSAKVQAFVSALRISIDAIAPGWEA
jgi:hypothetical protein